jgi:acyl-CoA synthetase (AMP-forming)/AMP-acid ligase II
VKLDLEKLHPVAEIAAARRDLAERWLATGLHDEETLPDALARAAREDPDVAIVLHSSQRPGRLTLATLDRRARAVADALSQRGLAAGDVVAIQLPNWEEAAIAYAAVAMVGAVFVPIVHIYGPKETGWILEASGARMFICPDRWDKIDYLDRIARMPEVANLELVIVGDALPEHAVSWNELERSGDTNVAPPRLDASDVLLILYTSGTTADPKGVIHSHQTLMAELRNMPQAPLDKPDQVSLMPWPAGHIGGLCALLGPIVARASCVLIDRWNALDAARLVERYRVDMFCGAPIHVAAMLDVLDSGEIDLSSVRDVMSGGAGVPPALVERADAAGWRMVRSYGSSEHPTITASAFDETLHGRAHTDGLACPNSEFRLVRPDGEDARPGEEGEVWSLGPEQCLGYTDPERNREAFAPGGWFRSGDVGVVDAQGRLTITDRIKDVIIRGGENLSSLEIENLLQRHPSIAEAAAVGMPDPRYGERVCAFVVAAPGHTCPGTVELRDYFDALGVARQKTPERVVIVPDLPRTSSGKVKKHELRKRLANEGEAS